MTVLSLKTKRSLELEKLWIAREFFLRPGVFQASSHALRLGSKADYYFDIDYLLNDPYQCEIILGIYSQLITQINQNESVDFLAFLEKSSGGTVGAIRLASAISIKTNIPNIVVRPGKEIAFDKVKVPFAESGLGERRAVIVSDHCTSGREVLITAEILRKNKAIVQDAVIYTIRPDRFERDRYREALVNLHYAFELPSFAKLPRNRDELEMIAINA